MAKEAMLTPIDAEAVPAARTAALPEAHLLLIAHCLTKLFLSPLQASLFLRFYPGLSSKTASSLISSGAVEEFG